MRVGLIAENPLEWLMLRTGRAPTPLIDTMHTFILAWIIHEAAIPACWLVSVPALPRQCTSCGLAAPGLMNNPG